MILSKSFKVAYSAPVPQPVAQAACAESLRYFSAEVREHPNALDFTYKSADAMLYDGTLKFSNSSSETQISLEVIGNPDDANIKAFVQRFEDILVGQLHEHQAHESPREVMLKLGFRAAYQRCLEAIDALGWTLRHDMTREDRIACYVPIPALLPNAPVYFISLYEMANGRTRIALVAASDELSQSHAVEDFRKLKEALMSEAANKPAEAAPPAPAPIPEPAATDEPRIFISYRRYDSADVTGRIYDRLLAAYGKERLFKDVDSIPFGADFRKVINEAVGDCAVVLAVIGRDWVAATNERGQRRLDDPTDFVRLEIEAALERNIPLIPLLVRETSMPRPEDLPDVLRELCYRHGTAIRPDPDFHRDMDRLIEGLNTLFSQ